MNEAAFAAALNAVAAKFGVRLRDLGFSTAATRP
jgi:hypothetical protein